GQNIYAKSWWGPANMARLQSCKSMEGELMVKAVAVNTYDTGQGETEEGPIDYPWGIVDTISWNGTSFKGSKNPTYDGDSYLTVKGTVSPDGTQIVSMSVLESPNSPPGSCDYLKFDMASVLLDFPKGTSEVIVSQTGPEVKKYFVNGKVDFCGRYDHAEGAWKEQRIESIEWTDSETVPNLQIAFH
ncbi:MAG: hypothetical protein WC749_08630, partial [Dehalococcoidia bacterium]